MAVLITEGLSAEHRRGARSREGEEKREFCGVGFLFGFLLLFFFVLACFCFLQRATVHRSKIKASLGDSSSPYIWSFAWRQRLLVHKHDAAGIFAPLMVLKKGEGERWQGSSLEL